MSSQVTDTTFDSLNATHVGVAAEVMTDDFVFNAILLSYGGERDRPELIKLGVGRGYDG